jgi:membrane-bound metal-dependent hydrolase YbcI (DUF457 family)
LFIGHFAVGFAGKKLAPKASLPALLFAALFADILWPVLVAVGAEKVRIAPGNTVYTPLEFVSYPWSHSLLMLLIWGGLIGAFFRKRTDGRRIWAVIAALVVSHWFLDWITHAPDMPVYPGGPGYGLALWNNVNLTMIIEIAMFAVGVWMYWSVTRARDGIGRWAFGGLVALLLGFFIFDSLDPSAPPSVKMIWTSALIATAVVLAWAAWIDRHRSLKTAGH